MAWPSPLLGLPLLLPLLPLFWVSTGADVPYVSISLSDDIGQQDHREINLTCDASGIPEPRIYEWNTTTGILPPYAEPQGAQLLLQPSEESINITFICYVSSSLWTAQGTMNVVLPGRHLHQHIPSVSSSRSRRRSHYSGPPRENPYLIALYVVGGVLLLLLFCCQFYRKYCKEDSKASGRNKRNKASPKKKDHSTETVLELDVTVVQETNSEDLLSVSANSQSGSVNDDEDNDDDKNICVDCCELFELLCECISCCQCED